MSPTVLTRDTLDERWADLGEDLRVDAMSVDTPPLDTQGAS
jgi:hypothetical protein